MTASMMSALKRRRRRAVRVGWRVGRFAALALVMLAVTATGLYQVHQRYELVRLGYQLDEDRFEHRRLLETNKRLRLSLATWKDPTTVRAMAEDQLGMRQAEAYDEFVVPGAGPADRRPLVAPPVRRAVITDDEEAAAEDAAADGAAADPTADPTVRVPLDVAPPGAAPLAAPAPLPEALPARPVDPDKASPLALEVLP